MKKYFIVFRGLLSK